MGAMQDLTGGYAGGTAASRLAGRSAVYLSLTGARELIRTFHLLPVRVQKKVARAAVTKVARRVVKVVKQTMNTDNPKAIDSGLLQKSIGFRVWTPKTGQWAVGATIRARKGMGRLVVRLQEKDRKGKKRRQQVAYVRAGGGSRPVYADPHKYVHLVALGTKDRETKGGADRGKVEEHPFFGHAYLRSRDVMAATLRTEIRNGIEREARKLAKAVRR